MVLGGEGLPLFFRRERSCLRVGSVNVKGLDALGKLKESVGSCGRGSLDVMGIQETHTRECGVMDCTIRSES